tara:strand:+ start:764 stop:1618 length:855 start_codon:yes stop_codon:yes gene_type:complete
MTIISDLSRLLRISQWYKNLLIFVPLIFSLNLFNLDIFLRVLLGFLSLSLLSSSYYIINDLKDIEKDKHHPEKKKRPLASGRTPKFLAALLFFFLFINSLAIAFFLSNIFFTIMIVLFALSQIYNLILRNIAFFDIIAISLNFVVRILSGSFLIGVTPQYPLVLSAFFLSVFMVSGKRISETYLSDLIKYRPSLSKQHKDTLTLMATVSVASTIILFSFYALEISKPLLLLTLPLSFYLVLVYFNSVFHNPEKIRNPEKFIFDKRIILSLFFWTVLLILALYVF